MASVITGVAELMFNTQHISRASTIYDCPLTRYLAVKIDNIDTKIRYFLKIAEHSSLSQAAEEIGISQSGLSRQLAILESYVRRSLFERTGHGIRLTDAGKKLRFSVQTPYEKIDEALLFIRDQEGVIDGKLSVATTYTVGLSFVAELLDTFVTRQAGVNLSITSGGSQQVLQLVERRVADIGFLYDSAVASELIESIPLFDNIMCIIARRGDMDPDAVVNLASCKLPLVSYPRNYALREMLRSANLESRIVAEANTLGVILQLVGSGIGQCILPDRIPGRMLAEYNLIKIRQLDPPLKRRVVAIVRRNNTAVLARKLFIMAREISNFE